MKTSSFRLIPILAAFCLGATALMASTVIVYDNFNRGGTLNGSIAVTGQTWAGAAWNTGPYLSMSGGNGSQSAIGGLTFAANSLYTLSMDVIVVNSDPENWVALGFYGGAGNALSNGMGSMLVRTNNDVSTFTIGSSTLEAIAPPSQVTELAIELTTGATLASSTLRYKINGNYTALGGAIDASTIKSIYIQNYGEHLRTRVDNFTLTQSIVPEPSSALLGLAGAGLYMCRRRRN